MSENKIVTKHRDFVIEEDGEVDDAAGTAVTPGDLVEKDAQGDYTVHGTAGGTHPAPRFARKAGLVGGEISETIAAGEHIEVALCQTGVHVYARLAAGENAAYGELLSSAGDGTLRSAEDGTSPDGEDAAVVRAAEAVDNSGGGSAVRILAEVL